MCFDKKHASGGPHRFEKLLWKSPSLPPPPRRYLKRKIYNWQSAKIRNMLEGVGNTVFRKWHVHDHVLSCLWALIYMEAQSKSKFLREDSSICFSRKYIQFLVCKVKIKQACYSSFSYKCKCQNSPARKQITYFLYSIVSHN